MLEVGVVVVGVVVCLLLGKSMSRRDINMDLVRLFKLSSAFRDGKCVRAAHRGGGGTFGPENTMETYQRSVHLSEILEIDLRTTLDNHLVLLHDSVLHHTTNAPPDSPPVHLCTLQYLKTLDAGYYYREFRGKRCTVPTFHEVLDQFLNNPNKENHADDLIFFLDIKTLSAISPTLKIVEERGISDRVIMGAVEESVNKELMRLKPQHIPAAPDIVSTLKAYLLYEFGLLRFFRFSHHIFALHLSNTTRYAVTDSGFLQACKARGRKTAVFGPLLDEPQWQKKCIDIGVDIIFSDRPDILATTLKDPNSISPIQDLGWKESIKGRLLGVLLAQSVLFYFFGKKFLTWVRGKRSWFGLSNAR